MEGGTSIHLCICIFHFMAGPAKIRQPCDLIGYPSQSCLLNSEAANIKAYWLNNLSQEHKLFLEFHNPKLYYVLEAGLR